MKAQLIRKILGLRPQIGDKVKGYKDYAVEYEGIVVEMPNKDLNWYKVKGTVIIHNPWIGEIRENGFFYVNGLTIRHK